MHASTKVDKREKKKNDLEIGAINTAANHACLISPCAAQDGSLLRVPKTRQDHGTGWGAVRGAT